jgi:hypothetical protein
MASKREELLAALAEEDKREKEEKDRFEVEIGSAGNYARVPYEKARSWLQATFGIDLDAEDKQDPPADEGKDDGKPVRFGRRVS